MQLSDNVRILCFKVHTGIKLQKKKRRGKKSLQIVSRRPSGEDGIVALLTPSKSPPFNFKHEAPTLPGLSMDEYALVALLSCGPVEF
jgi:hypothetical protein